MGLWGWRQFAATGGLVDHCLASLASEDLGADARRLREAGFEVAGPADSGRRLLGGGEIRWRSAIVTQEGRVLPFPIEDLTPRPHRVPAYPATDHPNGAVGVSAVEIAAPDPEEAARSYSAMMGNPAAVENDETRVRLGLRRISFSGSADGSAWRLEAVGSGPCAVNLADGAEGEGELDPDLAHGARIRLG